MHGTAAALLKSACAGVLDQNPPHQLRCHREEVRPIPPSDLVNVDQPEERLVHQSRRRKHVPLALARHLPSSQAAQFVVAE